MERDYIQEFVDSMPVTSHHFSHERGNKLYAQLCENPQIVESLKSYHLTATYALFYQYNKEAAIFLKDTVKNSQRGDKEHILRLFNLQDSLEDKFSS